MFDAESELRRSDRLSTSSISSTHGDNLRAGENIDRNISAVNACTVSLTWVLRGAVP